MLTSWSLAGYRSIADATLPLARTSVVVGPNGSGKSNLYRGLTLLGSAATGALAREFAAEGGFGSALWAGPRGKGPVRMRLSASWDDLTYTLELGLPSPDSPFPRDPVVKAETVVDVRSGVPLAERRGGSAMVRDEEGQAQSYPFDIWSAESILAQIIDPRRLPVLSDVRDRILSWRSYHHFRTDPAAPMRQPRTLSFMPVLDPHGADLAAALHTITEVGDDHALATAVEAAFPGCRAFVDVDGRGQGLVMLNRPGLRRPLAAAELSDGTLRFLCLAVALLSPRPPQLLALNEPETSLHEELLPALSQLLAMASDRSQLWITTHSQILAETLAQTSGCIVSRVHLDAGRSQVVTDRY